MNVGLNKPPSSLTSSPEIYKKNKPPKFSLNQKQLSLSNDSSFQKKLIDASRFSRLIGVPSEVHESRLINRLLPVATGGIGGFLFAYLSETTGLSTALHEVVGHGLLGLQLTHDYPPGEGPKYQVDGWDNFKTIWESKSFQEGLDAFGKWLTGYDRNGDGAAGVTKWNGSLKPNELGQNMGRDGLQAWISLSGSLPGLLLNTLCVAGGMKLKERHPAAGYFLLSYGIMQHLFSSFYPWSAAIASDQEFYNAAVNGTSHDFVNFSAKIGNLTGADPKTIAITTASLWTAFVPAVALAIYFYQKAHQTDIVPDHIALQHWLGKARNNKDVEKTLEKYLEKYPRKKKLEDLWKNLANVKEVSDVDKISEKYPLELRRFAEYLLDKLPKKILKTEKKEVLKECKIEDRPKKIEKVLTGLAIFGTITSIATKILQILSQTFVPVLSAAATGLTFASPLFVGVSVISSGYETYKDLKSPDKQIPKAAKMISVAKLVVAVASAVGIIVGLFVPTLNLVLISAIVLGAVGSLVLSYARYRVIKQRFELLQSTNPVQWNFMYDLLRVYKEEKNHVKVSKKDRAYKGLKKWLRQQHKAKKNRFISKKKIEKLQIIGVFA